MDTNWLPSPFAGDVIYIRFSSNIEFPFHLGILEKEIGLVDDLIIETMRCKVIPTSERQLARAWQPKGQQSGHILYPILRLHSPCTRRVGINIEATSAYLI